MMLFSLPLVHQEDRFDHHSSTTLLLLQYSNSMHKTTRYDYQYLIVYHALSWYYLYMYAYIEFPH